MSEPTNCEWALQAFRTGNTLFDQRSYEDAVAAYDQGLALAPDRFYGHYNRGIALALLGRYEEVVAALDRTLALVPTFPAAHINKGKALEKLGRTEEAWVVYTRALALHPPEIEYNRRGIRWTTSRRPFGPPLGAGCWRS